jgi:[protein-PII] uridylyltransferase
MSIEAFGESTPGATLGRSIGAAASFEWRDILNRQQAKLKAAVLSNTELSGIAACAMYSELYEKLLASRFESCRAALGLDKRVTLGAVGSFGRRTLSPNSDLDVRILCEGDLGEASESLVASLLYPLWDAGLDVGHQVITIEQVMDLGRTDLTTATALLDWRTIGGDPKLGTELVSTAMSTLFTGAPLRDFVESLEAYNRARHARYGDSVYLLEPNVKSGAGGLRDLDVAHWYARAEHHVSDLSELVERGVLLSREWAQIDNAREQLFRMRNTLHALIGRKVDRLTFDHQELLSERLGYGVDPQSVERMMSEYYRNARTIRGACEMLAPRAGFVRNPSEAEQLEAGIGVVDGELVFERPDDLDERPVLALRIYLQAVERERRVAASARRAIARMTSSEAWCEDLRTDPDTPALFRSLVCSIRDTHLENDSILGEVHDVGLLLAILPEFSPVVGRVHHDTYHVYTVDVHSIAAVDYLRKLARGTLLNEHPLACRLAAEQVRREVLFFATLLHDVGKVLGGVGHAERGALMAVDMLKRLDFDDNDIADVQLLIRLHLHLYQAATRRDVEDAETIRGVCQSLGSQEALRELYLLTVADVTTTSPRSMTHWKRDVLDELYTHADRYLSAMHGSEALAQASTIKDRILSITDGSELTAFLTKFLNGLPERYLFANGLETVIAHAQFARDSHGERSSIRIGARRGQYTELWVVADDQPGLLALITATFWRAKLTVLSAQVYTWVNSDGKTRSLDTFWVRHRSGSALSEAEVADIHTLLQDTLDSGFDQKAVTLPPPSVRMGGAPPIVTEVTIDNRSATNHSVIEVITQDRPNLLYWLSCRLQELGLDIWFAKISTEGDRVVDVFYVSDQQGGKILNADRLQHIKSHLVTAINQTTPERKSSRPPPALS